MLLLRLIIFFALGSVCLSEQTCLSRFDYDELAFLTLMKMEKLVSKFDTVMKVIEKNFEENELSRNNTLDPFVDESTKKFKEFVSDVKWWEVSVARGIYEQKNQSAGNAKFRFKQNKI